MKTYKWALMEANLNPATGAEQRGSRPVLIVSNEEFNQAMPNITVLPITSTKRSLYPSEVFLPRGKAGQPLDSIIMAHQIRTISKMRLGRLMGYLEDDALRSKIDLAVKEHLDLK
ncbi:MAG: type II toxin-antitoxin system PemK/MazF family toxin [Dehalococcoidales bacterium]|jgi:mRNA interferase MazF|nr:type II toxin-antitoxin system PemK/MazF family toxin [Dehalococcoidales bacterium]MDD5122566.1 type II toxin-antitoxin system PemK/MazF family toxin [Dehalococcoidales bacterium]